MEDPVSEIPDIILSLTTAPPPIQHRTLTTYFTPSARFDHPLCCVPSFTTPVLTSRDVIIAIYRWYKLLSPRISIAITSAALDEANMKLYVEATQVFTLWFVPWISVSATLVSVLTLVKAKPDTNEEEEGEEMKVGGFPPQRYYICSQTDLYQFEQWIGFFPVLGLMLRAIVMVGKWMASAVCWGGVVGVVWCARVWGCVCGAEGGGGERRDWDGALEGVVRVERGVMGNIGGSYGGS